MNIISGNLQNIRTRMASSCAAAQRDTRDVALLAVSKTFDADAVREAAACGQRAFGENYIQEAVEKIALLADLGLEWHCIGPIQSNKTRLVAQHFDWVHTIDRLKIAQRLSEQRPPSMAPLNCCLQVNIDGGATKSGLAPEEVATLAREVMALPGLRLRGLMTIPEPTERVEDQLAVHRRARALFDALRGQGLPLDTLSMGMSGDMESAIAAGSTMVRVGTALFGGRPAKA
ncbi:MAG: YggS family pyridoxal phosphate-dependent enzyme [Ramlibacter sp.]|jgi:pyridoxal phosphate enzyme (YggS family)|uniref:YggS family pyridoxal phosphate-dependent enzyme n=1 Tax=Ramlibacter sp. TaxID=1917967 RepID=UPI0026112689|nr:YggS family pyridoxal phosphate-dependent enzyme [Ramlibacter sp.]MDH4377770.1 YggS family pyridoxal phosphate-dependent enzyme [Ramlibacter sp.]